MSFLIDHDFHIHSGLSLCSKDPAQTPQTILQAARAQHFTKICLTDHFWDDAVPSLFAPDWYRMQNYGYVSAALPLPQDPDIRFFFGCETELAQDLTLAISRERMDSFDFIIIPTTHLHLTGVTIPPSVGLARRTELWVERLDAILHMDLPFEKIGIAHLTCSLIADIPSERDANDRWTPHIELIRNLPENDLRRLFSLAAEKRVGIELNLPPLDRYTEEQLEIILHPYRIAREEGCLFYFGSDAHHPDGLMKAAHFAAIAERLELDESDRFTIR